MELWLTSLVKKPMTISVSKSTFKDFFNEIKKAIKEYFEETEIKIREQLKKLLITSIITVILVAVVIAFIGTAVVFIVIGGYKYLSMFLPAWLAWMVMGLISIIVGLAFLFVVYIIIRNQLRSPQKKGAPKSLTEEPVRVGF